MAVSARLVWWLLEIVSIGKHMHVNEWWFQHLQEQPWGRAWGQSMGYQTVEQLQMQVKREKVGLLGIKEGRRASPVIAEAMMKDV